MAKLLKKNRKPKVCVECGRVEGDVKFTETKAVCNLCRSKKVMAYENTPERLVIKWESISKEKGEIFVKGKVDPCIECNLKSCLYCSVFQAKKLYLCPGTPESKRFNTAFNKNLLDNIKKLANVG